MARGKAATKRGLCVGCGQAVAWKDVPPWTLFDAELDSNGIPLPNSTKSGQRYQAGTTLHACAWFQNRAKAKVETQTRVETVPETLPEAKPEVEAKPEPKAVEALDTDFTAGSVDVDAIVAKARGEARAEILKIIEDLGIKQETVIRIEVKDANGASSSTHDVVHKAFPAFLRDVAAGVPTYLYGPAGSGKTTAGELAGISLSREVIIQTMPGLTVGKLLGFQGLDGQDITTPFLRAFTEGLIFVADEFDRALPSVGAAVNSALANGKYTIGNRTVSAAPGFAFVATGNTDMRGATRQYTAAQPMDLSTAARFAFHEWSYDSNLELAAVSKIIGRSNAVLLCAWVEAIRAELKRSAVETVFAGPRESIMIAKALLRGHSLKDAVDSWIWRGYPADAVRAFEARIPLPKVVAQ